MDIVDSSKYLLFFRIDITANFSTMNDVHKFYKSPLPRITHLTIRVQPGHDNRPWNVPHPLMKEAIKLIETVSLTLNSLELTWTCDLKYPLEPFGLLYALDCLTNLSSLKLTGRMKNDIKQKRSSVKDYYMQTLLRNNPLLNFTNNIDINFSWPPVNGFSWSNTSEQY